MPRADLTSIEAPPATGTRQRKPRAPAKPKRWEDKHTRRKVWLNDAQAKQVADLEPGMARATIIARLFDLLITVGGLAALEKLVEEQPDP